MGAGGVDDEATRLVGVEALCLGVLDLVACHAQEVCAQGLAFAVHEVVVHTAVGLVVHDHEVAWRKPLVHGDERHDVEINDSATVLVEERVFGQVDLLPQDRRDIHVGLEDLRVVDAKHRFDARSVMDLRSPALVQSAPFTLAPLEDLTLLPRPRVGLNPDEVDLLDGSLREIDREKCKTKRACFSRASAAGSGSSGDTL